MDPNPKPPTTTSLPLSRPGQINVGDARHTLTTLCRSWRRIAERPVVLHVHESRECPRERERLRFAPPPELTEM